MKIQKPEFRIQNETTVAAARHHIQHVKKGAWPLFRQ